MKKVKKLKIEIIWRSNEYYNNPTHVELSFTSKLIKQIEIAQKLIDKHKFDNIRIPIVGSLLDELEECDFPTDIEQLIVYNTAIYYYAQYEDNSSVQIESDSFTLNDLK